ncbi:MAG: type I pullulanase [Sarcina sp.]
MEENIFLDKIHPLDIDKDLEMIELLFNYKGELGVIYNKKKTIFRVWGPTANNIKLVLYNYDKKERVELQMKKEVEGVWDLKIKGDLHGIKYTYLIVNHDGTCETTDPYGKNISEDGKKSIVVDMKKTNPKHWNDVKITQKSKSNIIYEMSVRDFTIDENSGVKEEDRGKYKGLAKLKSKYNRYGMDYIIDLGVTHVQLMPVYDFSSGEDFDYNWGYNPKNYNIPEKKYSTSENEISKIVEFKEMIMNFHINGIKVIMDVVYNHHTDAKNSNFNKIVPGYYFRKDTNGNFSNGSGCGNEFATERRMARKFIVDSMFYWVTEYKIDGFRLDLMGLYDIETIEEIRAMLDSINKDILLYGEPWKGGDSVLSESKAMLNDNMNRIDTKQISCFNDTFRDCVRGKVFDFENKGFVSGGYGLEEELKHCIVGGVRHNGIDYNKINHARLLNESYQSINYNSCHDNHTLFDKLKLSNSGVGEDELIKMNLLTAAILLTSQGNSFIHSGEEFLREKVNENGDIEGNSYKLGDYVNKIYWERVNKYNHVVNYYKKLIAMRKEHKCFNINSAKKINENIEFIGSEKFSSEGNIVAYTINGEALGDNYKKILIAFNGSKVNKEVNVDKSGWDIILDGEKIRGDSIEYVEGDTLIVRANSALIAVKY